MNDDPEVRVRAADYGRAESYLPWNVRPLIHNATVTLHWIGETDRLWYRRTDSQGASFVLVDPAAGTREPAFDHARLAAALSVASGTPYVHTQLPFDEIRFQDEGQTLGFTVDGQGWTCDLADYTCTRSDWTAPAPDELRSPDGKWAAFRRDGNLWLREVASGQERVLTEDAEPYFDYASLAESRLTAVTDRATGKPLPPAAVWSPDSARLLTYRLDQRAVEPLYLLQSVPPGGSYRPVLHSYRYPLPGDAAVATAELLVFDAPTGRRVPLQVESLPVAGHLLEQKPFWWSKDGRRVYTLRADRGGRSVRLSVADAETGTGRTLLEESGATTVFPQHVGMEINTIHELEGGGAFTWFSARSGWGHLYLYDAQTGAVRCQLTSGPWTVRDVVHLDEAGGWLYFTAGGREPARDPYFRHLYRCRLDGTDLSL
ncbi:MAG TPA: DPP IV N-terminal domain-containing protein, partial [Thermomicrobiaceae bacterium]|nr:DPP IV N-terminal domain-containing protein [Thermomicrobiaceae bacterium]